MGDIKDDMQNDHTALQGKRSKHEIIFKRESYFSDVATLLIGFIITVVFFKYFIVYFLGLGIFTYLLGLIIAFTWILLIISHWQNYYIIIIVDEHGITEKYSTGGGWSYKWSEVSEWNALIAGEDGDREIRFTTTDSEPKTHTLPIEKIGKDCYKPLKSIFLEHCGKPTKIDSWLLANAPDDE